MRGVRHLTVGTALVATTVVLVAGPASATTVTVRPGTDLTSIARSYGTTVAALEAANGISNPNLVFAGAVLQIPGTAGVSPAPTTVTVRAGDDLTSIARRYGTTVAALDAANGITNPNHVKIGAVLQIPSTAPAAAAAASAGTPIPTTVVVGPRQDLTQIAARYDTTVAALVAANDITNPNHLQVGTLLRLPSTWVLSDYNTSVAAATVNVQGDVPAELRANPATAALYPTFVAAAAAYGLPPSLLEAMCWWESGWQAAVVSPTGAVGECQLEPYTTAFVNSALLGGAALNADIPAQNIDLAAAYLHYLLSMTAGNEHTALAAYYQGLLSVQQSGLLASTQTYVQGILAYAAMFAAS